MNSIRTIMPSYKGNKVARPKLLTGKNLLYGRKLKNGAQDCRHSPVTEERLIIKYKGLKFASFNCHQNHLLNGINWGYCPCLTLLKRKGIFPATGRAYSA